MASRKRPPPATMSLFATPPHPARHEVLEVKGQPVVVTTSPPPDPLDTPKLRLVHSQAEEEVAVEPTDDGRFWISLVKHGGGTRASVLYTRKQLEMLLRRIPAALELG